MSSEVVRMISADCEVKSRHSDALWLSSVAS
jgi:hypothetical protein